MVDDVKVLVVSITDLFLQCYDFSDTLINKFPLSFHKFLPLISTLIEKSRVDFPKDIKVSCYADAYDDSWATYHYAWTTYKYYKNKLWISNNLVKNQLRCTSYRSLGVSQKETFTVIRTLSKLEYQKTKKKWELIWLTSFHTPVRHYRWECSNPQIVSSCQDAEHRDPSRFLSQTCPREIISMFIHGFLYRDLNVL